MFKSESISSYFNFCVCRPQKKIWHGSGIEGVRAKTAYCEAWHSDNPSNVGLASDLLRGQILGQENVGCHNKLVVLCVEIASHNNYHRRRRSLPPPAPVPFDFSTTSDNDNSLRNLTLEQYTQVLETYDQNSSTRALDLESERPSSSSIEEDQELLPHQYENNVEEEFDV